jgi:uncharacterized protein
MQSASVAPARLKPWIKRSAITLCFLGVAWIATTLIVRFEIEKHVLTTKPNGPETPAKFGTPFVHAAIPSDARQLDASMVIAPSTCANSPVLLIYHGMGETISDWAKAQQFLYTQCISSIVFDPTGAGDSPRPARLAFTMGDSIAAYQFTTKHFAGRPVFLLGHSLGNAFLLDAAPHLSPAPAGIIEANGFASVRSIAGRGKSAAFHLFLDIMPSWWDNVQAVQRVHVPLMVIASDGDYAIPIDNGRAIFAAAPQPKRFVQLHGFGHNAMYKNPTLDWWAEPLAFLRGAQFAP